MRAANTRAMLLITLVLSIIVLAGFSDAPRAHSVTITWKATPSTRDATVVGYNLYRRTTPTAPYEKIATHVAGTTYEDRQVTSGTTYRYWTIISGVLSHGRGRSKLTLNRCKMCRIGSAQTA